MLTFLDYDRDGNLDLFVTQYQELDSRSPQLLRARPRIACGKTCLSFAALVDFLSVARSSTRNRGDGTFENVSVRSKISEVKGFYAFTAIAADLTGDGWTDIYVACDSTPSLLSVTTAMARSAKSARRQV